MGNLFNKYFLSEFIKSFRTGLSEKIDKLEITEATDLNELLFKLTNEFTIAPLDIKEANPSEPVEAQIDCQDMFGRPFKKKVFKIKVSIPFDGNKILFFCSPSTSTVVYIDQSVVINSNYVSAEVVLNDLDANQYHNAIGKIIGDLKTNIPIINSEIAPWNSGLENQIKHLLEQRKGIVSKKFDFMEKIGLKVNPKSNEFMMPTPIEKKKIPEPVSDTSKDINKDIVPILQEEVFNDIKEVLYNVGKAIERKPSIYLGKHEEDLRDIFLLFLETRYESTSGVGEAFNKKGKTDILLKFAKDGSNIFVAECKVWKGQKKLHEGVDQLLGYLTHRDSKTALMIFVDQKEISSVISTIKEEIKIHKNYKRFVKDNYDSSFSYDFTLPEDSQKTIQVEVMVYHFPK